MFLVIHVLLGALIGVSFSSASLVFALAFVSHFFLDVIPHWDNNFDLASFKKSFEVKINKSLVFTVLADFFLALFLSFLLFDILGNWLVFVGAFAAMLPDILKLGYFTPLKRNKWYRKHLLFHAHIQKEVPLGIGILTQVVTVLILIYLLF